MIQFRPMMFVLLCCRISILPIIVFVAIISLILPLFSTQFFTANCISCFLHIYLLNFMYFTIFIPKSSKLAISSILALLVLWSGLGPTFNGLHLKIKGSLFSTLKIFRKFMTPDLAKPRYPPPGRTTI